MNCIEVASNLDLFIDEELPYETMVAVSQHLSGCPGCEEKHNSEVLFKQTVKSMLPKRCCTESLMNNVREVVLNHSI